MLQKFSDWLSGNLDSTTPHWKSNQAKMFLRLALARMRLKRSKIENSIIQQRHRAAQALREGNDDQARLLVEEMFRAQHRTQALVQLLLLGEHLLTRIDAIELSPSGYDACSSHISWHHVIKPITGKYHLICVCPSAHLCTRRNVSM
jgi:hypothetical protein